MQLWGKAANGAGEGGWLRALEVWGSGSAWLAAWGNCGQCFVRGRRIAEGSLGASPGDSASRRQSVPPAPAGPRGPRACGTARAPVCFSESGESLLWGGGRRAGERWRRLGSDVAWGRGAAAAHPRADAHGPGPRGRQRAGGSRLLGPWGAMSAAFCGVESDCCRVGVGCAPRGGRTAL